MFKFSLVIAKLFKKNAKLANKIIIKLNKNIHKEITYPSKIVMIISNDIFDFSLYNNLSQIMNYKSIAVRLNSIDDLNSLIINKANNKGIINADIFAYVIKTTDIKNIFSFIPPTHILITDFDDIRNYDEIKELVESKIVINKTNIIKNSISYSLENDKKNNFYLSTIDFIKERITINQKYVVNVKNTNESYLDQLMMFFSFWSTIDTTINIVEAINKLNKKKFSCKNKAIFLDLEKTDYNNAIKFITRFKDYKVLVIGWHLNIYEDVSWFYNIDFERLLNKNIQKIYCIGVNAYDIATRLKYADFRESNIIVSPNIDLILKDLCNYNMNLYVLVDKTYEQVLREGLKKN